MRDVVTTVLEVVGFLLLTLAGCVWLATVSVMAAVVVGLTVSGVCLMFVGWYEGRRP